MWRKIVNPIMIWLLRSPLHALVSGRIMLISVKGRKSGRVYLTPVDYGRDGGAVLAVSSAKYAWWKNLSAGGTADLLVAGRPLSGPAEVSQDPAVVLATLRRMYPGHNVDNIAPGCVAIRVDVAGGEPSAG